jgi:hypothetical protein
VAGYRLREVQIKPGYDACTLIVEHMPLPGERAADETAATTTSQIAGKQGRQGKLPRKAAQPEAKKRRRSPEEVEELRRKIAKDCEEYPSAGDRERAKRIGEPKSTIQRYLPDKMAA